MKNYRLELSYDGTRYRGWQKLGDSENTIQNRVETVLGKLLGGETELTASGRTDAGVHARCQVCSFKTDSNMAAEDILDGLRQYLPKDIGALSLTEADERFHARYNCREKTYLYRVWNSDAPNVFEKNFVYFFPQKLDTDKMREAAALLEGEHDFSAFTSAKHMKKSAVRNISGITIESAGDEIDIYVTADGFLWNMVRIITGTLLEVGTGKRRPEDVSVLLEGGVRSDAGFTVPACGLILFDTKY